MVRVLMPEFPMHMRNLLLVTLVAAACSEPMAPRAMQFEGTAADAAASMSDFTILANAAVTCTDGTIVGDIGTFQAVPTGSFTQTSCPLTGTAHIGDGAAVAAYEGFLATYAALTPVSSDACTMLTGTLAGVSLAPGTYCFDAAATLTGTLTLAGPSNGTWLFLIGTSGTGALTGTDFTVVMSGGAKPCNVTWWVAEAATMTTSNFIGTILAGAAITLTGGTYAGDAFSKADVTVTGTSVVGCDGAANGTPGHGPHAGCNQGVGNGPEACDPGNSNHRRPTNDEAGGTPGMPGRQGSK